MTPSHRERAEKVYVDWSTRGFMPTEQAWACVREIERAFREVENAALETAALKMEAFGKMYLDTGDTQMKQAGAVLSAYVVKLRALKSGGE